jgi:hypothetical protein
MAIALVIMLSAEKKLKKRVKCLSLDLKNLFDVLLIVGNLV